MATERNQEQKRGVAPEGLRRDQHQEEQEKLPPRIGAVKPEDEEGAVQGKVKEPPARGTSESE